MKIKRLNTGLYEATIAGKTFHIEDINRASDGDIPRAWMLYEVTGDHREYCNDFPTLRAAKRLLAKLEG